MILKSTHTHASPRLRAETGLRAQPFILNSKHDDWKGQEAREGRREKVDEVTTGRRGGWAPALGRR